VNSSKILGFAVGPISAAILGFISIPMVAWTFSPEDVGRLNVFQVTISFALLLFVLGLDQAYVREYNETEDRVGLLRNCVGPGLVLLVIALAVTLPFAVKISELLYGQSSPWPYVLTASAFSLTFFSRFLSLILRVQERGLAYSMGQLLPKVFQLLFVAILFFQDFDKEFIHLLVLTVASFSVVLVVYGWNTRHQWIAALYKSGDAEHRKKIMKFGFPLIFSGMIYWGLIATSNLAIRTLSDFSELATYSVGTSFASVMVVFQSIFTVIWAPTVYKWVANGVDMSVIDVVCQKALAVACALVACVGAFAWVSDILLPEHYSGVKFILLCCCMQPVLYTLSEITCVGIAISRRTTLTIWVTLVALVVNVIFSFILVPTYGARGAAVANTLAFLVFFVGRTEVSSRVWRRFPRGKLYLTVVILVTISVASALQTTIDYAYFGFFWALIVPVSALMFVSQWKELYSSFLGVWRSR
jgi:O-antigen/teichoic acid export membrane protein